MTGGRPWSAMGIEALDVAQRERSLAIANAEAQRELLASRLGVPREEIHPCLALIGGQPEERRAKYAGVIAYQFARIGITEEQTLAYLGWYVGKCDQPPLAGHRFSDREARAIARHVYRKKARGQVIHGFGCIRRDSPLLEYCPYGAQTDAQNRFACPYVSQRLVKPNRRRTASLTGAMNLLHMHLRKRLPEGWRPRAAARRSLLYLTLAKLEVEHNHPGGELWTSERKLHDEFPLPISRRTIRTDLAAMHKARWIEWTRGKDHTGTAAAGRPPLGMRVMRLLPGDALMAAVEAAFPGAEEED
jgi:hypothetical protein